MPGKILVRVEEEGVAREWSFAKIAVDMGADIGLIEMSGDGTAVVSKERQGFPPATVPR